MGMQTKLLHIRQATQATGLKASRVFYLTRKHCCYTRKKAYLNLGQVLSIGKFG